MTRRKLLVTTGLGLGGTVYIMARPLPGHDPERTAQEQLEHGAAASRRAELSAALSVPFRAPARDSQLDSE